MWLKLDRLGPAALLRLVAEAVLLFLIAWSPWPFASVEYSWESILIGGSIFIVWLWVMHGFFQKHLNVRPDGVAYCLLGLVALSALQLISLPQSIVGTLSPQRVQLNNELLPATLETLPGESDPPPRPNSLPLSWDPFATRVFLAQTLTLLLLYLAVRSWLASRESLRRVAWVATFTGIALAIFGLCQFFSSPHPRTVVYWSVETGGAVFGPFICKNHYPDFVLFCLGLGVGLIISRQAPTSVKVRGVEYRLSGLTRFTDSPDLFIIGSGLVLVLASIPFTLSRGGLLATVVATVVVIALVYATRGRLTRGFAIGGMLTAAAMLLGGWFGWGIVSDRLDTLWSGQAASVRGDLWSNTSKLIPNYVALGCGHGAFIRIEPLTRTVATAENYILENAHNEYLEAILEGGLVRLALTLALCYFALRAAVGAYLRLKDRSTGPLVLGILFGMVGLIVHSIVDFGIHMPAVALLATVLTAYVADAATDPAYVPYKKKSGETPERDPGRRTLQGPALYAFGAIIFLAGIWLLMDSSRRGRAEELKVIARNAQRIGGPGQLELRLKSLTEAVDRTPGDAVAWTMLAQARLDLAVEERRQAAMALGGAAAVDELPSDLLASPTGRAVTEGLAAARTARGLSPLLTRPHRFLALYAGGFTKSEPARVHLDRATRTSPMDPQIRIDRGSEAASRRDLVEAVKSWQSAMAMNPALVPEVLVAARRHIAVEQILSTLLPADPALIFASVEQLHPTWKPQELASRKAYLERIASLDGRGDWTASGWAAIAQAHTELGHSDKAFGAWRKAIDRDPDNFNYRNGFCLWLESDERYAEAESELLWLRERRDSRELIDRLDAVRHARNLQRIIEGR